MLIASFIRYKEAKENLCLSLLFVSNEKEADRDSLDIQ